MKMLPTRHSGVLDGGTKLIAHGSWIMIWWRFRKNFKKWRPDLNVSMQSAVWVLVILLISYMWRNWHNSDVSCLSTSVTKLFYFIPFELSFSTSFPRINIKVLVDHDKQSFTE